MVPFFRSDIGLPGDSSFPGFRGRGEEFGVWSSWCWTGCATSPVNYPWLMIVQFDLSPRSQHTQTQSWIPYATSASWMSLQQIDSIDIGPWHHFQSLFNHLSVWTSFQQRKCRQMAAWKRGGGTPSAAVFVIWLGKRLDTDHKGRLLRLRPTGFVFFFGWSKTQGCFSAF